MPHLVRVQWTFGRGLQGRLSWNCTLKWIVIVQTTQRTTPPFTVPTEGSPLILQPLLFCYLTLTTKFSFVHGGRDAHTQRNLNPVVVQKAGPLMGFILDKRCAGAHIPVIYGVQHHKHLERKSGHLMLFLIQCQKIKVAPSPSLGQFCLGCSLD